MALTPPWIYFAGPLFTQAEMAFNQSLADELRSQGYRIYLPQQECLGTTDPKELYRRCMVGLDQACLVLVILDGTDADSGSCFEMGYAYAKSIPILGLRTDFRGSGEHLGLNLMLTHSCTHLILRTTDTTRAELDTVTYISMDANLADEVLMRLPYMPGAETAKS